jgi:hypothetical protein
VKYADGTCGAWSQLLVAVLETQGISATQIRITPNFAHPTFINYQTLGGSPLDVTRSGFHVPTTAHGQGMKQPGNNQFTEHAIVAVGSTYYDPSYNFGATGPNAQLLWEDHSVWRFAFVYANDTAQTLNDEKGVQQTSFGPSGWVYTP